MKRINWNKNKDEILKRERNISFELIKEKLKNGDILDDIINTNDLKYGK